MEVDVRHHAEGETFDRALLVLSARAFQENVHRHVHSVGYLSLSNRNPKLVITSMLWYSIY